MDLTISKQILSIALQRTAGIADRKSSMQILANVLIDATMASSVRLSATDLKLYASGVLPAQVIETGSVTVAAKMIHDVVKSLPEGEVRLRTDNDQLIVSSGRAKFKLLALPADDFPRLPETEGLSFFEVETGLLARMIDQTSFSISTDDTRPHLNGALFQGDGKKLRMVTTDGHRLNKVEHKVEEAGFYNFSMVIPQKGIMEFKRMIEEGSGHCKVAAQEGQIFVQREFDVEKVEGAEPLSASFLLVSKLIDSDFPNYDQVIPSSSERVVIAPRVLFLEALRRVSVVSSDRTLGVKFQLVEGSLEVMTNNPSVGEGAELVDVTYEGEKLVIGFNARYIIDALSTLTDDEIKLEVSGPLDPMVIKDMSGGFVGVVMPMRI
ncbi:MAG: DNA polymerase III subunit beta [Myxococcota bacterium]|jgi:DNA polymerase-3 subunit beta|nr:DNA polymerase III subunit beta [Myxococcota bacterium]